MVLGIFKIALRLRDRHLFMWQSVEILNVFNTLTLRQIFWKTKTFFQKNRVPFLVESTRLKTHHFHTKLTNQKPMLRQIEWWVQNIPFTKNEVLPVTTSLFWKFCFSLRTSYKVMIWCTGEPNSIFLLLVSAGVLFLTELFPCEYP